MLELSNIVYSHLFSCFCKINNYYHLPHQVFFPTIICLFLWFIRTFFYTLATTLVKKKGKKKNLLYTTFKIDPEFHGFFFFFVFFAVFSFIYFPYNICINFFSPFLTLSKQILHCLHICPFLFFIYHSFNNSLLSSCQLLFGFLSN